MIRITIVFLVATANGSLINEALRMRFRVIYGHTDTEGKYAYVVSLIANHTDRVCTGTLLSPVWVLTAAHCFVGDHPIPTQIQYGNMSEAPELSNTISNIEEIIPQPGHRGGLLMSNDIALIRVSPVHLPKYGTISAVDYTSVIGMVVEYAGYGATQDGGSFDIRPLQIGEGVVIQCINYMGPYMCVAPKCSNKDSDSANGDSGGPLFHDGKVIAVVSWGFVTEPIGRYAAMSPFLTWIQDVIDSKIARRKF